MRYDHDIKWVRRLLKTADIANTMNGGISEARVKLLKKADHYLLKSKVPGVDIAQLKVEIIDKKLFVYHNINFGEVDNSMIMVPHVIATLPLSPDIDFRKISATAQSGVLQVVLPFNELTKGFHKNIEIER